MKTVYGVQWIEIEFGERDEGMRLYLNKEQCIAEAKADSEKGWCGHGQYVGPERPIGYYEIPFDSLGDELKEALNKSKKGVAHTENRWSPKFKSNKVYIKEGN